MLRHLHGVNKSQHLPALHPEQNCKGGACMKYVNARTILPIDLVEELQKYIQAGYIYIPAAGKKKRWGERSGYRTELHLRNEGIRQRYVSGCTIEELSTQYALSAHAIKKIIYQKS
jgi:Mor family transcriptional regulator